MPALPTTVPTPRTRTTVPTPELTSLLRPAAPPVAVIAVTTLAVTADLVRDAAKHAQAQQPTPAPAPLRAAYGFD